MSGPASAPRATVIGAGVIGLSTAVELLDAGFETVVVARDLPADTTSAVAAAVWLPFHVAPLHRTAGWGGTTFRRLERLAASPDTGVQMRVGTHRARGEAGDPWWEALPDTVLLPEESSEYAAYQVRVPAIDMALYLPWLEREIITRGGVITRRHVASLRDVPPCEVVVNCTGLGSRELVGDTHLHPVRGQIVEMHCPGIDRFIVDGDNPAGLAHIFMRTNTIILGGVAEESDDMRIDDDTTRRILDRCAGLDPRVRDGEVVDVRVGLRPGRSEVRLEVDAGSNPIPVVHNYGHGGAGVTMSWGCAGEVRELCVELAAGNRPS